jgi:hypothetical protein
MGVDCSIKVRLFQEGSDDYKEVKVSEQDNSLASLFFSKEVSYTSIKFDRHVELTPEQNALLEVTEDEDGMMACSNIIDAQEVLKVFDSIDRKLRKPKRESLNNDLTKINLQLLDAEEKEKRMRAQIGEYLNFESSSGLLEGILKTAVVLNLKVQIVLAYY